MLYERRLNQDTLHVFACVENKYATWYSDNGYNFPHFSVYF